MTTGFDRGASKKGRKNGAKKNEGNEATYVVQTEQHGEFIFRQQRKRVTVVALYCDCGRSILVKPKDVEDAPVICSLCNSSFSWQQLAFKLD